MSNDKRDELRKKLNNKIKQKQMIRNTKEQKEEEIKKDENLSKLGINSIGDLAKFMDNIKDIDREQITEQLVLMGLHKEQIDQFFTMCKK